MNQQFQQAKSIVRIGTAIFGERKMKIAFIGYGNMASALIKGILISEDITLENDIFIFHNKDEDTYKADKCVFLKNLVKI